MTKNTLKCASFFAGVGGIDMGFDAAGFDTIYANELDSNACKTFERNFAISVDNRSICDVQADEIPDFDIMLGGFPCQAFSIAGRREGFDDSQGRGALFFELQRLFEAKQPSVVFFENVKNLVTHDNGNTLKTILTILAENGYHVKHKVLNACEYGNIPQNRERIYIVGFKDQQVYERFDFPKPLALSVTLSDVIDFNNKVDVKYYYNDSFKHYDVLCQNMVSADTVYQWRRKYVRENKSNLCPTLTANMGTGGHNVPLILSLNGIRKLTPKECFKLQGFPNTYQLPELANSHLYKQAGNSVCVGVVERIANCIQQALV